ncbi:hypothetical protein A0H81_13355 [Grifola frondosa]|uniref:Uncharacterized protein n=1 Tax=Grifola frondosa TaxID=5627 RepID=A0A1C7LS16_GRIFR|nr:hypothetical protein A0H81_13355 [Grifola frondosa]
MPEEDGKGSTEEEQEKGQPKKTVRATIENADDEEETLQGSDEEEVVPAPIRATEELGYGEVLSDEMDFQ